MTHADKVPRWLDPAPHAGVEIGAFKTPVPGIAPHYVDRYAVYAGARALADHYGDVNDLPFATPPAPTSPPPTCSSTPPTLVAALWDMGPALRRHDGILYMVVPDHR